MPLQMQTRVVELAIDVLDAKTALTPPWLMRPGKDECGALWPRICDIYAALTGLQLPDVMPSREHRRVDAVLSCKNVPPIILEFDEKQHFNQFRALTLAHYHDVPVGYDIAAWLEASKAKRGLEGGGFAKSRPPLFAGENGRHKQRAFRDALCDLLPPEHGFAPTLRIADFEVRSWIFGPDARGKMAELLASRLLRQPTRLPANSS